MKKLRSLSTLTSLKFVATSRERMPTLMHYYFLSENSSLCDQLCKAKGKNVDIDTSLFPLLSHEVIDSEDNLDECFCDGAGTDFEEVVDAVNSRFLAKEKPKYHPRVKVFAQPKGWVESFFA